MQENFKSEHLNKIWDKILLIQSVKKSRKIKSLEEKKIQNMSEQIFSNFPICTNFENNLTNFLKSPFAYFSEIENLKMFS